MISGTDNIVKHCYNELYMYILAVHVHTRIVHVHAHVRLTGACIGPMCLF